MNRPAGRRVAQRPARRGLRIPRPGPDLIIGLVAVLVTGATLATVAEPEQHTPDQARTPGATTLTQAELTCPAGAEITVAQPLESEGAGALTATSGDAEPRAIELTSGTSTVVPAARRDATVLRATGDRAPGLIAAARDRGTLAECVTPGGDWWFAAAGAGGLHVSTLTLTNPDDTPAVADLEIWGADGPVASDAVRGIAVDGGMTTALDLSELVPQRDDAVVHVIVRQGRLGAAMHDETVIQAKDRGSAHPATQAPSTRAVIPGVPGAGARLQLVLGNPGEESARAEIRVSGAASESAPAGLDAIPVPAGEVVSVELDRATRKLLRSGGASLVVEGTAPLVSSVRGTAQGGPITLGAVPEATRRSAVVLPRTAERTLVLMTTAGATPVTVHFEGAEPWKGRLVPQASTVVPVPKGATLAWVEATTPHLGAVRGRTATGPVWLPLRELREDRRVPVVQPDQLRSP